MLEKLTTIDQSQNNVMLAMALLVYVRSLSLTVPLVSFGPLL